MNRAHSLEVSQRVPLPERFLRSCPPRVDEKADMTLPYLSTGNPAAKSSRAASKYFNKMKSPNRSYKRKYPHVRDFQMLAKSGMRNNDPLKQAMAYYSIGILYDNRNDYARSIDAYKKFLNVSEEIGDREAIGLGLNSIGVAYHLKGNLKKSLEYHQYHRNIAADMGGTGTIIGRCNEGLVQRLLGDYDRAEITHKKALEESRSMANLEGESLAAGHLGIDHIKQSVKATRQLASLQVSKSLPALHFKKPTHRPDTRAAKGQKQISLHMDLMSVGGDIGSVGKAFQNLGNLALSRNQYDEAVECYQKARMLAKQCNDRNLLKISRCQLGIARGTSRYEQHMINLANKFRKSKN